VEPADIASKRALSYTYVYEFAWSICTSGLIADKKKSEVLNLSQGSSLLGSTRATIYEGFE
jgi:hypothetical protein